MMRAFALLLAVVLAQSIEPAQEQEWQPDPHRCETRCAAIPKDTHTHKACACGASKGESCDANGNRTQEEMAGCKNRKHCLRGCCDCCPKD